MVAQGRGAPVALPQAPSGVGRDHGL